MQEPKEIIRLDKVNVKFRKSGGFLTGEKYFHVLKDIDLTVNKGDILVMVGESGCGKTTVGKVITGLLKTTEGTISYQGRDVYRMNRKEFDEYRRGVQFVQQDSYAALNPARTIYQSLSAPVRSHDKKLSAAEADEKIKKTMQLVGLNPPEQYLSKYPHQLSGGQRQRLLIARAISLDPKLIVTDEPVSMIDVSLRLSILNLMKELNEKLGIAFVYITHDLATARYIGDRGRICVMYLGEIVERGEVNKLLYHPRHPYTQALLSAVPIPDPEVAKIKKELPLKNEEIESLEKRPAGCCFYGRCIYSDEACREKKPEYAVADGTEVLCRNYEAVEAAADFGYLGCGLKAPE